MEISHPMNKMTMADKSQMPKINVREMANAHAEGMPLPMITIDSHDLPDLKRWKIGGKYQVVIDIQMKALRGRDENLTLLDGYKRDSNGMTADFVIQRYTPVAK